MPTDAAMAATDGTSTSVTFPGKRKGAMRAVTMEPAKTVNSGTES